MPGIVAPAAKAGKKTIKLAWPKKISNNLFQVLAMISYPIYDIRKI
ncbi:MAG: hypothetical protein ALAOOOJD_01191 [bacterium]|nr:hypothetical protein [bacterium]